MKPLVVPTLARTLALALTLLCAVLLVSPARPEAAESAAAKQTASPAATGAKEAPAAAPAKKSSGTAAAAAVNGEKIPAADVDEELQSEQKQRALAGLPGDEEADAALRTEILDRMIAEELIYQVVRDAKDLPTAEQCQQGIERIKAGLKDPAKFDEELKRRGTTMAELVEVTKRQLAIQKWLKANVETKVEVSDADLKAYYDARPEEFKKPETVTARHVVVRLSLDATPAERAEARKKIEAALARIRKGEDFAAVAKQVSEDKASAAEGGDVGLIALGEKPGAFERAAFALAKGQVSAVVESATGLHVIQVTDKSPAGVLKFEEVKERLREFLLLKGRREKAQQLVGELRKKAKVELF